MAPSTFTWLGGASRLPRALCLPKRKLLGHAWPAQPSPRGADKQGGSSVSQKSRPRHRDVGQSPRGPTESGWQKGTRCVDRRGTRQTTKPTVGWTRPWPGHLPAGQRVGRAALTAKGGSPSSLRLSLAAPGCEGALPPARVRARPGHLGLIILKLGSEHRAGGQRAARPHPPKPALWGLCRSGAEPGSPPSPKGHLWEARPDRRVGCKDGGGGHVRVLSRHCGVSLSSPAVTWPPSVPCC